MLKYVIARCPLNGQEYTASDWWEVISRHQHYECADTALAKITKAERVLNKHIIFMLKGYQVGEQFNIKSIQDRHKIEASK